MESLYQLKNSLDDCGIFLSFSGPISQDLMVELGDILKKQMEMADAETSTILKVFSVLVEQSQNIIRHSAESIPEENNSDEKLMFGSIAVGYKGGKYFVLGGNKIKNCRIDDLKQRLTLLQNMTKDQLKDHYRKQRKKDGNEDTRGAGLGLIDLSRKASEPINFHFESIDEDFSFFSLRTLI